MSVDFTAIRISINARLPRRVRWMLNDTPFDFDFSANLRPITDNDLIGGPVPAEWSDCRVFGMYDIAEGGGASPWIAIRESDGFVCGLDIEAPQERTFLFNSSLDRFISTFSLFDQYLRTGTPLPPDFMSQAQALDAEVSPVSEWQAITEYITNPDE